MFILKQGYVFKPAISIVQYDGRYGLYDLTLCSECRYVV